LVRRKSAREVRPALVAAASAPSLIAFEQNHSSKIIPPRSLEQDRRQ
jgi:hypothetical protein